MSKSQTKISSPARSQGFITPRRRTRRTLSSTSPAQSEVRLSTVVEKFVKSDKFVLSPMGRRSVLPDGTDIEAPRRASWWKRVDGSSRSVLEDLDTNKMTDKLLLEEYEFDVEKDDKQSQSVQQSQSSDNESVASIVVPQRRLFNRKKQTQAKFGDIMGSRKSLGKTNIEDESIEVAPKNLFNKGPRNRPVFPAALLNSTNKTDETKLTVEPETNKLTRPNLFGQAGTKRKNMFADFVLSDSEEDSEVEHKIFGFKKNNKRLSLGTRSRRMPSLTPSMTTEIDIDDWNLLPSSTMIGPQEASRMSDKDMELQDENQDNTLTEDVSLNRTNKQAHKSVIHDDENDKTLTNENIEDANKSQDVEVKDVSKKVNKTHEKSKTKLNTSVKDKSLQNKSTKQAANISNAENVQIEEVIAKQQQTNAFVDKNTRLAEKEQLLENKIAELHGESVETEKNANGDIDKSEEQSEVEQEENEEPEQSEEEQEPSEEEHEPSLEEQENQNQTDEAIKDQYEDMVEKDKSDEEMPQEDQDEDMEEMVWNDNDDEKLRDAAEKEVATEAEQNNEVVPNEKSTDISKNLSKLEQNADKSKNISNKSHKIVDVSVDNNQSEEDVVEETPNNSTRDTTGRNRKKEVSKFKSPEAVLQNITHDNESFRPIGRSTTFRKSKSLYETMNMRHTLDSEGSRNSSTEGSEWDSHRTTRKTIRQTLGKEFTTRKSLRALVMEQSAKRQTELYNKNMSKFDKTKNKTVAEDQNDKNASNMNKTKNKTVVEDGNNKNATTRNTAVIEDANSDNASKNKTKNKTVLDDINDQYIRRSSNRNISRNQSPILKSSVHGTSTHHVPDPLILEYQASYHKSLHDIKDPEISKNLSNPEQSVNILIPDNNDSGPEISMNASYGQGMSASGHEIEETSNKVINKDISRHGASIHSKSTHHSEEVFDYEYEASEQVISDLEDQENSEHESMQDEKESESEEEMEQSEQEIESEREDSQQEIEADSEYETQEDEPQEIEDKQEQPQHEMESVQEECQQELEDEQEQSQHEIESDQEESQQEIEDEQEQSQHEIESDQEESQQEIEDEPEQSQHEMESEQESQQEIESEEEQQSENEDYDMSQEPQESDHDIREPENDDQDNDDFISALNSEYQTPKKRGVSRIVFDSNMSVEEIDFEGLETPPQTDNDITENNESEREPRLSIASLQRVSEPRVHDVSVDTKRSMFIMQMEKITQEHMERRQKFREKLEKKLKQSCNCNFMSPIQPGPSIRRMTQPEPRKPKRKPKPTGIPIEALPKAFVEDLKYKPPKRFAPANASWITKRLYKYLEAKLEPKYDYRARVRAEELVQNIYSFAKLVRRHRLAPSQAVDELKREMARLRIVNTHHDFYCFFREFMPREIRIKVNPDIVNMIPVPRNVFSDILTPRTGVE